MNLQIIENKIYEIRGVKVMLDFDLAEMYEAETRRLNETVKRNIKRFPSDFMFQLTQEEWNNLMSQFATSSWGGTRKLPFVFTEQGVAMLSGLLKSDIAIEVNINIMRAFVAIRSQISLIANAKSIEERVKALEEANEELLKDVNDLSEDTRNALDDVFDAFAKLSNEINIAKARSPRRPIGFTAPDCEEKS